MKNPAYVLGHSAFELERLGRQESLIGPVTQHYFLEAGLAPGMRVLDVGSGTGVVAFRAAAIVGPSGQVIGTDLAPAAVAQANEAAAKQSLAHVSFRQGDPCTMSFDEPFDAVVGRYVLMFQADPAMMLRQLAKLVRPGGLIVFQEPDLTYVRSDPVSPEYDRCCEWVRQAFVGAGTRFTGVAPRLVEAFRAAGLPSPTLRMQLALGDAVSAEDWLRAIAELAITLAPAIERQGLASTAEIAGGTLADRIVRDVAARHSFIVGRAEVGAWTRLNKAV